MTVRALAVPVATGSAMVISIGSAAGLMVIAWPLLMRAPGPVQPPFVFAAVLPLLVAVMLAEAAAGRIDARALAVLGVLSALGAAVRPLGAGTGGVETVFVIIILGGRAFGPGFGFVLGAITLFASALLTGGVGPWLPIQMLAAAWVGLGAGLLPAAEGRREIALLAAYATVAAFAYGLTMNLWFWPFTLGLGTDLSYVAGAPLAENLGRFTLYTVATSLGWDLGRAITTVGLLVLLGPSVLGALRRAARRARFG